MLFSTIFFLMYFLPAALALYWACHFSIAGQNFCLLIISLVFYAWGEPLHLIPMAVLIVGNHFIGLRLIDANNPAYIGRYVKIAAVLNIGTLLAIRYGPHVLGYAAGLAGMPEYALSWRVPFGISFFALQAFLYIFDIARGKAEPSRSIVNTGLFIAFLPTVLFGPILNYRNMEPQFRVRPISLARFGEGGERLVGGLAKLILLAVPLHNISSTVFGMSLQGSYVPVLLAWLGLVALGLYYYMLLSGFADMAIGIGGLFGFTLPENFRYPYLAHTVTEFCNRWNITLFRWFYVCVFLPLGGRQAKMTRYRGAMRPRNHVVRNLALLWLGIGLWYGFGLNYLLLGLWFYIFFFIEWLVTMQRKNTSSPLWIVYVLFVAAVAWVFVRCGTFEQSLTYFANLSGMNRNALSNDFTIACLKESWHVIIVAAVAATPVPQAIVRWLRDGRGWFGYARTLGYLAVMAGVLYLCYIYIGVTQYATFSVR